MNQQLQALTLIDMFNYQGNKFRHIIDENGDPRFVAADVCEILDLGNVSHAVNRLDEDEKGIIISDTLGGNQPMLFVTIPGLNRLIFTSRKPEAKTIQRWVYHDVLPAIYKTGSYGISAQETYDLRELFTQQPTYSDNAATR